MYISCTHYCSKLEALPSAINLYSLRGEIEIHTVSMQVIQCGMNEIEAKAYHFPDIPTQEIKRKSPHVVGQKS